jgi:precorrin-6A/cobalt-precorrin-6A reductase
MISQPSATPRLLLLGGTTEASQLAQALAAAGVDAVFSYAGRTHSLLPQPLPTRVGGFGGVAGLRVWLCEHGITHVIDATHPFAVQMSTHAVAACSAQGVRLIALERPAWTAQPGDDWREVHDMDAAASALPQEPARVFLAIGRQHLAPFTAHPQHHYLLRMVDAMRSVPLPQATVVTARGPFGVEGDLALMQAHRITHVVARNAGGAGAAAKLAAARALGLPVVMVARPAPPARPCVASAAAVMAWLAAHGADLGV